MPPGSIPSADVLGILGDSAEKDEKPEMKSVFVENDDDSIRKQNEIWSGTQISYGYSSL